MRMLIRCSLLERERFLRAAQDARKLVRIQRFGNADYDAHWLSMDLILDGFAHLDEILDFAERLNLENCRRGSHLLFTSRLEKGL